MENERLTADELSQMATDVEGGGSLPVWVTAKTLASMVEEIQEHRADTSRHPALLHRMIDLEERIDGMQAAGDDDAPPRIRGIWARLAVLEKRATEGETVRATQAQRLDLLDLAHAANHKKIDAAAVDRREIAGRVAEIEADAAKMRTEIAKLNGTKLDLGRVDVGQLIQEARVAQLAREQIRARLDELEDEIRKMGGTP